MPARRFFALALLSFIFLGAHFASAADGDTQILKWPEGKKAAFLLAFDDGAPSQLKYAVPELERRKLKGTFYLNPGNKFYPSIASKWEASAKSPYVVVANHTFTHQGVTTAEELDQELGKCNEVLFALKPEGKKPRLFGFARPGGVPWTVSKEEFQAALAKHHLVERPPFQGPPINVKSAAEMIAAVDAAVAKGDTGHMDFHGVGTDWHVTPLDWFLPFLDKLQASESELWITDVVSWAKYLAERDSAKTKTVKTASDSIEIELSIGTDPQLFDQPLSLATNVPAAWSRCAITQGQTTTESMANTGVVRYTALPAPGRITIRPIK